MPLLRIPAELLDNPALNMRDFSKSVVLHPGAGFFTTDTAGAVHHIHRVSNALADSVSISIHVYGGNIGGVRRAVYTPEGLVKPFVSGYSNRHLPNIWDLSKDN